MTDTETETKVPRLRSHVANFDIYLGDMLTRGRLVPVEVSKPKGQSSGEYHLCSPDEKRVKQVYRDDDGTIFQRDELLSFMETDEGEMKIIDKEAIAEAKKSTLELNSMHLTVHELSQMTGELWPDSSKKSFVFMPDSEKESNVMIEQAFLRALSLHKFGLVAVVNLKNHEALYQLVQWRGRLVVQPQVYTDALNPHTVQEFRLPKEVSEKIARLCELRVSPFDASAYINDTRLRVQHAEAIALGRADGAKVVERASKQVPDLMSILDAAIGGESDE